MWPSQPTDRLIWGVCHYFHSVCFPVLIFSYLFITISAHNFSASNFFASQQSPILAGPSAYSDHPTPYAIFSYTPQQPDLQPLTVLPNLSYLRTYLGFVSDFVIVMTRFLWLLIFVDEVDYFRPPGRRFCRHSCGVRIRFCFGLCSVCQIGTVSTGEPGIIILFDWLPPVNGQPQSPFHQLAPPIMHRSSQICQLQDISSYTKYSDHSFCWQDHHKLNLYQSLIAPSAFLPGFLMSGDWLSRIIILLLLLSLFRIRLVNLYSIFIKISISVIRLSVHLRSCKIYSAYRLILGQVFQFAVLSGSFARFLSILTITSSDNFCLDIV